MIRSIPRARCVGSFFSAVRFSSLRARHFANHFLSSNLDRPVHFRQDAKSTTVPHPNIGSDRSIFSEYAPTDLIKTCHNHTTRYLEYRRFTFQRNHNGLVDRRISRADHPTSSQMQETKCPGFTSRSLPASGSAHAGVAKRHRGAEYAAGRRIQRAGHVAFQKHSVPRHLRIGSGGGR